jgi:hypothetical protein
MAHQFQPRDRVGLTEPFEGMARGTVLRVVEVSDDFIKCQNEKGGIFLLPHHVLAVVREAVVKLADDPDEPNDEDEIRAIKSPPRVDELTVYIDPGDAPQELITELYLALSALYRAHGGSGLKLVSEKRRLLQAEEVGS